jgi:hypothetical protein
LRPVAGYRRIDKRRNEDLRQEINIFILCEKNNINKIIMNIPQSIPCNLFDYTPKDRKDRGQPLKSWRDQFD